MRRSVLQDWVMELTFMQQSVLIAAMRGPDGVEKNHPSKALCKWLRRCIVISAFDKVALVNPYHTGGGSYTGPSIVAPAEDMWENPMRVVAKSFLDSEDSLPHHFILHFIHAAEILGYKHSETRIQIWWRETYFRFCKDMHMAPELEIELDRRLSDDEKAWRSDESRFKS